MRFLARVVAFALALGATLPRTAASLPGSPAGSGPDLARPWSVAVEASGALLTVDPGRNAVLRVDPATGARQVVSDFRTGTGPALRQPSDIAILADGVIVVRDGFYTDGVLITLDPVTGDRTLLSGAARGKGPLFAQPRGIAADGNSLLVADASQQAVFRVDGTTGDRTIVSGCTQISGLLPDCVGIVTGTGPALSGPVAVAVEDGGAILVGQVGQLVRVDPQSGDRTLVSDMTRGSGPPIDGADGLAVEASGSVLWTERDGSAVLRIDPARGDRVIVSDAITGSGPAFKTPHGLAVEAAGTAVLCDSEQGSLLRIAPASGLRTLLSGGPIGSGPPLQCATGLASDAGGVFATDVCLRGVLRLDTATGDRTLVSGAGRGSGPHFLGVRNIARESAGTLLVLQSQSVLRVDPQTGNRTLVSSRSRGGGPRLTGPRSIAVEPAGSALVGCNLLLCAAVFCTPEFAWEIVRVDAGTGERSLLSGGGLRGQKRGAGPLVESSGFLVAGPAGDVLAVSAEGQIVRVHPISGDRTLVWDGAAPLAQPGGVALQSAGTLLITANDAVVRFDPSTGASAIVSDPTHGAGPFLQAPGLIAVQPDGTLIVIDHSIITGVDSVLRVDPVSGDRTYIAR